MADPPASAVPTAARAAAGLLVVIGLAELLLALFGAPVVAIVLGLDPTWAPGLREARSAFGAALAVGVAVAFAGISWVAAAGLWTARPWAWVLAGIVGAVGLISACPPAGMGLIVLLLQADTRRAFFPRGDPASPGRRSAG